MTDRPAGTNRPTPADRGSTDPGPYAELTANLAQSARRGEEPQVLAELATLGSLALVTGRARTSRDVARAALDILSRSTGADVGVVLFNPDDQGLVIEASYGFAPGVLEGLVGARIPGEQLTGAMLAAGGRPVSVDVESAPFSQEMRDLLLGTGLRHILLGPLWTSGRLAGLIGFGWRERPTVPPSDAAIMHASVVVGPSLENARLVERLEQTLAAERRLAEEEAALHSLTLLAERAGGFSELAETTLRQIVGLADAAAGAYALIDGEDLHAAALAGVTEEWVDNVRGVPAGSMTPIRRFRAGDPAYVQPFTPGSSQPRNLAAALAMGFSAYGAIPVRIGDRLEAVIMLWFRREVDPSELGHALDAVGRIASISLANFRLRERLTASETRYRVLFQESPDAIVLLSGDMAIVDANPAALRLYRTDLDGLRGFLASGTPHVAPDEQRRRAAIVNREGRGVFRDVGVRPDGTTFPEEIAIVRVHIAGEERFLLIVRDLTEQSRLQQELLQAQKMEAIGQLVSGVAHELNNPLAAIVAFSQLIRGDERLPADLQRDAELLVQEADRTRRIVQNLLDFARQRPPERHPTSIRALVESVVALQSYTLEAGRIHLDIDIPADLPAVDVDRSQLQQVLLNLTLNAIQAIGKDRGEGTICIRARHVGRPGDAEWVTLEVGDDGPGIPEALRPRLFVPFFTTKKPGEGTGLGLSVSFGIVAAHGGSLRFQPRPEGGALFLVDLPVRGRNPADRPRSRRSPESTESAEPTGAAEPTAAAEPATGATSPSPDRRTAARAGAPAGADRPRVLILDDEPAIRSFLTKSLRLAGFDPLAVADGEHAVELCRAERFACVVVDHRMPGLSGTEVYEAIVGDRAAAAPRFVFMSGDVLNPELRAFASERGVALLAKPFDVETVNRLVAEVVARDRDEADEDESVEEPAAGPGGQRG